MTGTSLKGNRLINIILLVTLAYSSAIFESSDIGKKQLKNMYFGVNNLKKDIEDGVHLVLVRMEKSGLIISNNIRIRWNS
ncbi:hypothetical protein QUA30_25680 [Microcoleus sp. Pol14C2]|uniref:hypothetical protein n=1 Tax=unclassified Microcoleus TaxID=2642155 RepID=UPI002FD17BD5